MTCTNNMKKHMKSLSSLLENTSLIAVEFLSKSKLPRDNFLFCCDALEEKNKSEKICFLCFWENAYCFNRKNMVILPSGCSRQNALRWRETVRRRTYAREL